VNFAHGALTSYRGHPEFVYVVALSSILYGGAPREAFTGEAFHTIETPADVEPALDRLQAQGSDTVKLVLANSEDHEARSAYLRVDENWAAIVAASADDSLDATTRLAAVERTSVGLDPALTPRIVERIHARGMRAIAHIDTVTDFDLAVRAGVDTIVHMPGIALAPGNTLENGTLTDAAIARAAQRGIGVVLTASVRPDFTPEADRPALHAMQRSNIRRLMEAGVPVYIGTDRWQAMASEEVAYLIEIGAMSPAEAFAAWIATSQAVFPERRIGRIAPGYEADLLVFEADPRHSLDSMGAIARRMKGGTWISQD
jgi:imidazolonepropionase-like amidohydrolase